MICGCRVLIGEDFLNVMSLGDVGARLWGGSGIVL